MTNNQEVVSPYPYIGAALSLILLVNLAIICALAVQEFHLMASFYVVMPRFLAPVFRIANILLAVAAAQLVTPWLNKNTLDLELGIVCCSVAFWMSMLFLAYTPPVISVVVYGFVAVAAAVSAAAACLATHIVVLRLSYKWRFVLAVIVVLMAVALSTVVIDLFTVIEAPG